MKNIILLGMVLSTFAMSGWTQKTEEDKAIEIENARLCKIYSGKTEEYKAVMRDDDFARATLANYERLQKKYCNAEK